MRYFRSVSLLGIVILLSITAACGGSSGSGDAPGDDRAAEPTDTTAVAAAPTSTTAVAADGVPVVAVDRYAHVRLELPGGPDWMAADDDFLYVKLDRGAFVRIDPDSLDVVGTSEIGGGLCQGIGAGYGAVWSCHGTDVVRIDPDTDEVVATIAVNKAADQGHLAAGHDRIWVLVGDGSALVGIDPATNQAGPPIALDVDGTDLAVDGTSVWIASDPDDQVVRLDPATGQVVGRLSIVGARVIDTADGIWVGTVNRSTVRIDPTTMQVAATVTSGPGRYGDIAVDGDVLWIRSADCLLRRAATTDATVAEQITADITSGGSVLTAFGAVWATAYDDDAVFKISA
jgi:hypothetical protein